MLSVSLNAFAEIVDIRGHWAESMIENTVNRGILTGYPDGTFKPDNPMTQAEFFALVNRSFGFDKTAVYEYLSVSADKWYANEYKKAKAQGYLDLLEDSMVMPEEPISRQMVSAILGKVLKLHPDESIANGFSDFAHFEPWAKGLSGAVAGFGYMNGYQDNTFRPKTNISRAEVSTILHRVIGELYDKAGIYGDEQTITRIKGNVTIINPGITLKNMVIEGNLYLTEGIGDGTVILDRITVTGTTTISGGKKGIFLRDSSLGEVVISTYDDSGIYLAAQGGSKVGAVRVQTAAKLEETDLTGSGFGEVILSAPDSGIVELAGDFERVEIKEALSNISVLGGTIKLLEVNGKDTAIKIDKSVRIETLTINQPAKITGDCYIGTANINSSNVSVDARPRIVNTATGLINVYCTAYKAAKSTSGGGGGGGGGRSGGGGSGGGGGGTISVTLKSVESLGTKTVDNGTAKADIGLPASVGIVLSDGRNESADVTWDDGLPAYDGGKAGTYVFLGTLKMPAGVTNTKGLKARMDVIVREPATVEEIIVIGVETFDNIQVPRGTEKSVVEAVYLPEQAEVTLNIGDPRDMYIDWDIEGSDYDGEFDGLYMFSGDLILHDDVTNPHNKKATVGVIVGEPEEIEVWVTEVDSIPDINVEYGTDIGSIDLKGIIGIKLSDNTEMEVGVEWYTEGYNGDIPGTYVIEGVLELPDYVLNHSDMKASVRIIVAKAIVMSVEEIDDINVYTGKDYIALPQTVAVTLGDSSTIQVPVVWDSGIPDYDKYTAADYEFTGTLILPDYAENPSGIEAKATVTVKPSDFLGTTLYPVEDITEFQQSVTAAVDIDYSNMLYGNASIKLAPLAPVAVDNNISCYSVITNDISSFSLGSMENIEFSLYVPDTSPPEYFLVKFYTDEWHCVFYENGIGKYELTPGWNKIRRTKEDFELVDSIGTATNGSMTLKRSRNMPDEWIEMNQSIDRLNKVISEQKKSSAMDINRLMEADITYSWNDITAMEIYVAFKNDTEPVVNIDRISYNVSGTPKILFTFDDGWRDVMIHGKPILDDKGFKATTWVNKEAATEYAHDDANKNFWFMDETELEDIYEDGWDIGNHTVTHPDETSEPSEVEWPNEYLENRDWILGKGWERGANHVCYPSGIYNDEIISILDEIDAQTARTTVYGIQPTPAPNLYMLKCINVSIKADIPLIKSEIDKAVSTGSSLFFMFHRVEPVPEVSDVPDEDDSDYGKLAVSVENFTEIVDYIYSYVQQNKLDVVTISQWYENYLGMYP